jgi:hypothetical protein
MKLGLCEDVGGGGGPTIDPARGGPRLMLDDVPGIDATWAPYVARYRSGEWRDRIFRDLVLADARRFGTGPTILDIGCGEGLDGSVELQRSVAEAAGRFIGVEPDPEVALGDHFTETHRRSFQEAPLAAGTIDVAYAVMVLEHLATPQVFWDKLWELLVDGGVFWGLTVDARHLFAGLSLWAGRLKIKDLYLDLVLGRASEPGRYRNYPPVESLLAQGPPVAGGCDRRLFHPQGSFGDAAGDPCRQMSGILTLHLRSDFGHVLQDNENRGGWARRPGDDRVGAGGLSGAGRPPSRSADGAETRLSPAIAGSRCDLQVREGAAPG